MLDGAADATDLESAVVREVDDLRRRAATCHKDLAALLDYDLDRLDEVRCAGQDVDAPRPAGEPLNGADLLAQFGRAHKRAHAAKAARVGDCRRQLRQRNAAHASQLV